MSARLGHADEVTRQLLARMTGHAPERFTAETRLVRLGMDSLKLAELAFALEEHFGPLSEETLRDPQLTFGGLVALLGEREPATRIDQPNRQARIDDFAELDEVRGWLAAFDALSIDNPYARTLDGPARDTASIAGEPLVNFATYNYLGLSGDERVSRRAIEAIERYGTSASASRVAAGNRPVHDELERALAAWLGCEGALVFASGHTTNVSAIATLVGGDDLVLHDALAHDSIVTGARLSGARRLAFPHNDVAALDRMLGALRGSARRALVAVEGVYSMDGDAAPLAELVRVKKRHGALLFVDEAHSLGCVGRTGRGIGEHAGVAPADVDVWMGTLSKALASCGGYIAGSQALVELMRYRGGGFVFAAGLPPASAAAALAALTILDGEPERVATLQRRAARLRELFRERGIDTLDSAGTPIVPALIGDSLRCVRVSEALRRRGVLAPPIIHPAVAEGRARLRFFVSALHSEAQLEQAAGALAAVLADHPEDQP